MFIYIWLIYHQLAIHCSALVNGCMRVTELDIRAFEATGLLEVVFEIPMIIKIYMRKKDK